MKEKWGSFVIEPHHDVVCLGTSFFELNCITVRSYLKIREKSQITMVVQFKKKPTSPYTTHKLFK